ncbi:hypothetical protein HPB51_008042 [Rhipicephalus microplus]|uniref:Uncharacterized protein n=1 Tax=Rhipicephalus microplus TaxID=6941 RepID=A0A9J6ERG5_RHIMP|nr:hypothetical protein HPB51_008042 [Rhipicephalus microplus]
MKPPAAEPTLGIPASELHLAKALDVVTNQQYHHLKEDGRADDQINDDDTVSRDATDHQSHAEEDASWQEVKSTKQRKKAALERRCSNADSRTKSRQRRRHSINCQSYHHCRKMITRSSGPGPPTEKHALAQATIVACQAAFRDDQFILKINSGSNIVMPSTRYEDVADKARFIRTLVLNGRAHAVHAYVDNRDDALRVVIHGVPMNNFIETLMAQLRVRMHGVEIITARMIGTTKSAAITFFGPALPRNVYYYGGHSDKIHQDKTSDPPKTKNLHWFCCCEEKDALKLADDKQSSQSHSPSPSQSRARHSGGAHQHRLD